MLDLGVRDLLMVEAVEEEGTLTKAAERLFRTQPALSQQLKELEERLGTRLYRREGRSLQLTPAGRRVLEGARLVLAELRRTEADVQALANGQAGTLRLSTECYTTYHWLPQVLGRYEEAFPNVGVEICTDATEDPVQHLLDHAIDLALITRLALADAPANLEEQLRLTALFEDEIVALVATGHPWAEQDAVVAEDFGPERIFAHQSCPLRSDLFTKVLAPINVEPCEVVVLPMATEAIAQMVRAGRGVTLMACWVAAPYLRQGGLHTVRVTESGLRRTWYAAARREEAPPYLEAFIEHLTRLRLKEGMHIELSSNG